MRLSSATFLCALDISEPFAGSLVSGLFKKLFEQSCDQRGAEGGLAANIRNRTEFRLKNRKGRIHRGSVPVLPNQERLSLASAHRHCRYAAIGQTGVFDLALRIQIHSQTRR